MKESGKQFVMSYSAGKDSTLALYRMLSLGWSPTALLVTINKEEGRTWFHGVSIPLLHQVVDALRIPLLPVETFGGDDYALSFKSTLVKAKADGAEACVFGDIDLEPHRAWCTERCEHAGVEAVFPLWQQDREELTHAFIDASFKAMIKIVDLDRLPESFVGKILTRETVAEIKALGADPCGENGEYHTFVYDGPLFEKRIEFKMNGILHQDHYAIGNFDS